jgi:hypothetical protein
MPKRNGKNELQYSIGEKWAQEFFFGQKDHGFVFDTRAHDAERNHTGPGTDVALTRKQIQSLLEEMNRLGTSNNDLVIVRTYSKKGEFIPLFCFIVVVKQDVLERSRNDNLYFRLSGKNGKEDWAVKGRELVRYYPINKEYLDGDVPIIDIRKTLPL